MHTESINFVVKFTGKIFVKKAVKVVCGRSFQVSDSLDQFPNQIWKHVRPRLNSSPVEFRFLFPAPSRQPEVLSEQRQPTAEAVI